MNKTILISNVTIVNYDQEIIGDLFIRDGKVETNWTSFTSRG